MTKVNTLHKNGLRRVPTTIWDWPEPQRRRFEAAFASFMSSQMKQLELVPWWAFKELLEEKVHEIETAFE
jgi:hypothetical protein